LQPSFVRLLLGLCCAGATLTLLACGGGGGGGGGGSYGLSQRVPLAALGFPPSNPQPAPLTKSQAFAGLGTFDHPIYFHGIPDPTDPGAAGWNFVVEQLGRIWVFRNDDAVTQKHVLIDLRESQGGPVTGNLGEEGLLGFCLDPDFETNGRFYVHYSAESPRRSVIARYAASLPLAFPPSASSATQAVILEVGQPASNHNAGMLEFGPDQMLYVSLGDGGGGNDTYGNGQNLGTLLGSMLRIDVRNPPPGQPYGIPGDNPFVAVNGARGEIWAYGLRNPWRWSFDRMMGTLWCADVGQGAREEVDVIEAGENLGWPVYEGFASHLNPGGLPPSAFKSPVHDYPRSVGTTIVGGYVYRGPSMPSVVGAYFYGDYNSERVFALVHDGVQVISNVEVQSVDSVASFGEDEDAELYAVSRGTSAGQGRLYRFAEAGGGNPPPPFPQTLSQTLLFTDLSTLAPAAGLVEYDVASPLWSDGATKRRWIGLPGVSRILFHPTDPWQFPTGTVVVKHFDLELQVGNPSSARRIETRVLIHDPDGWKGYSYRWNDAQTDAVLLGGHLDEEFTILDIDAPGGQRQQTWSYPSGMECLQCHNAAGRILGVRTGQLNRDFDYPAMTDNQLRSWNHIGLFTTDVGSPASHEAWPDPEDALAADLATRARSYLAANCAQCHRPGGAAPGTVDLRFGTPTGSMGAVGVVPQAGDLGLANPFIIRAGVKEDSVLWHRMMRTDSVRMPPLASHLVHSSALDLIGMWIDGGP